MTNVMGYAYFRISLFISLRPHDWRHVVLAVEDRRPGRYARSISLKLPAGAGSQLDSCPREPVLEINVDRAVGVRREGERPPTL